MKLLYFLQASWKRSGVFTHFLWGWKDTNVKRYKKGWKEVCRILHAIVPALRSALLSGSCFSKAAQDWVWVCVCGKFCLMFIACVCWGLWGVTAALTSVPNSFEHWPAALSLWTEEWRDKSLKATWSFINVCCHLHSAKILEHVFMLNLLGTCYFHPFSNVFAFNLCYAPWCGHSGWDFSHFWS